MKRVRCPKCDNYITFDEKKYEAGQSLVFVCPNCNKQFGIRMGVSKLRETRKEEVLDENANEKGFGSIVVIENVFAYKQVIPLQMGDNIIGRYMKNSGINCPIETVDPSVDMNHCVINVSRDKKGRLKYVLRDGPPHQAGQARQALSRQPGFAPRLGLCQGLCRVYVADSPG